MARVARELAKRSLINECQLNNMRIDEYRQSIQFLESLNKDHDLSLQAIDLQLEYIDSFKCCASKDAEPGYVRSHQHDYLCIWLSLYL